MIPERTSREIIGDMIRYRRKERNLTQQQLADLLGIDRQYVWRLENGRVNLTMDYLDTIIKKLNYTHGDFLLIVLP